MIKTYPICARPRYSKLEDRILKNRYVVENYFASLKNFNRIMVRKDRNLNNFMSFIYMANIMMLCKKHNLNECG